MFGAKGAFRPSPERAANGAEARFLSRSRKLGPEGRRTVAGGERLLRAPGENQWERALKGMRVKLRLLSAKSAAQQSPGWKSARSGLWNPGFQDGIKVQPQRARQAFAESAKNLCRPFRAGFIRMSFPGLAPWALLCRAFSALDNSP